MEQLQSTITTDQYFIGNLTFIPEERSIYKDGIKVTSMPPKQSQILSYLVKNIETDLKRKDMLFAIWGEEGLGRNSYFIGRSMDVHIAHIRKHLKSDPNIELSTIPRFGFKLSVKQ